MESGCPFRQSLSLTLALVRKSVMDGEAHEKPDAYIWNLMKARLKYNCYEGVSTTMAASPEGSLKYGIVRIFSGGGPSASSFFRPRSVCRQRSGD